MTIAGEDQAAQILSQDARGRVLVSRERREALLEEFDRSGMSGVRFAQYLGIKYTTLAHWLRRRRQQRQKKKLLISGGVETEPARSKGWIEAVVDKNGLPTRVPSGALRIYFGAGAYCQISTAAEVALAAELLVKKLADRAGLAKLAVHPHMLRHSAGFSLINRGTGIRVIKDYLGHESITSTTRYTQLDGKRFAKLF